MGRFGYNQIGDGNFKWMVRKSQNFPKVILGEKVCTETSGAGSLLKAIMEGFEF